MRHGGKAFSSNKENQINRLSGENSTCHLPEDRKHTVGTVNQGFKKAENSRPKHQTTRQAALQAHRESDSRCLGTAFPKPGNRIPNRSGILFPTDWTYTGL